MPKSNNSLLPPAGDYKKPNEKVDFSCDEPNDNSGPGGPYASGLGETKPSGGRASRVNPMPGGEYKKAGPTSVSHSAAPGAPNKKDSKGGY